MKIGEVLALAGIAIGLILALIILWKEEFKHYLAKDASDLELNKFFEYDFLRIDQKPVFLHYFSQECKSARVNIQHLQRITEAYRNHFDFYVVKIGSLSNEEFSHKYNLPSYIKIISDTESDVASKHKVVATPYALILTKEGQLIFKGNYTNQNGLCGPNDIKWSAPAIAMKFISQSNKPPIFPPRQTRFWGCEIKP